MLRGLQDDATYNVSRSGEDFSRSVKGSRLMEVGLPVNLSKYEGGLWHITQEEMK
ncbi:MAG: hypothetical protein KAX05_05035 [Bacteroidales bacterium]|nr:hypothetical protein [Bacteroidales bacterium]